MLRIISILVLTLTMTSQSFGCAAHITPTEPSGPAPSTFNANRNTSSNSNNVSFNSDTTMQTYPTQSSFGSMPGDGRYQRSSRDSIEETRDRSVSPY